MSEETVEEQVNQILTIIKDYIGVAKELEYDIEQLTTLLHEGECVTNNVGELYENPGDTLSNGAYDSGTIIIGYTVDPNYNYWYKINDNAWVSGFTIILSELCNNLQFFDPAEYFDGLSVEDILREFNIEIEDIDLQEINNLEQVWILIVLLAEWESKADRNIRLTQRPAGGIASLDLEHINQLIASLQGLNAHDVELLITDRHWGVDEIYTIWQNVDTVAQAFQSQFQRIQIEIDGEIISICEYLTKNDIECTPEMAFRIIYGSLQFQMLQPYAIDCDGDPCYAAYSETNNTNLIKLTNVGLNPIAYGYEIVPPGQVPSANSNDMEVGFDTNTLLIHEMMHRFNFMSIDLYDASNQIAIPYQSQPYLPNTNQKKELRIFLTKF